jgi:hypothetical protein
MRVLLAAEFVYGLVALNTEWMVNGADWTSRGVGSWEQA